MHGQGMHAWSMPQCNIICQWPTRPKPQCMHTCMRACGTRFIACSSACSTRYACRTCYWPPAEKVRSPLPRWVRRSGRTLTRSSKSTGRTRHACTPHICVAAETVFTYLTRGHACIHDDLMHASLLFMHETVSQQGNAVQIYHFFDRQVVPKGHYSLHLPDQLARWGGRLLSTFCHERKHRLVVKYIRMSFTPADLESIHASMRRAWHACANAHSCMHDCLIIEGS